MVNLVHYAHIICQYSLHNQIYNSKSRGSTDKYKIFYNNKLTENEFLCFIYKNIYLLVNCTIDVLYYCMQIIVAMVFLARFYATRQTT